MAETPIGLLLPQTSTRPRGPLEPNVREFGRTVEALGYDSLWMNESWGTDPVAELTAVACGTDDLKVGTAVMNVFTRTPASLAMTAASMARISNNRFILGLGTSHPELVEDLHNVPWERPVKRIHETLTLLRELIGSHGTVNHQSELFTVSGVVPLEIDIDVYCAALGPANRRVTGQLGDGWIPYHVPFDDLDSAFSVIADAAREHGRDPDHISVVPYVACVVDEDRTVARDALRANIARYIGGFTDDSYKNAAGDRFPDEADRIASAWRRGNEEQASSYVTDAMVSQLGIAGTEREARAKLRDLQQRSLVDRVIVAVPHAVDREVAHRTINALAPNPS